MTYLVVCAWCLKIMAEKECPDAQPMDKPISHSICPECLEREIAQINSISINETHIG